MVFSVVYKVYETVSGRRFISDLKDARDKGYISRIPHFNSIFNYLDHSAMNWLLSDLITLSGAPLRAFETDFALDSSGFATGAYSRWLNKKYARFNEATKTEKWVKCHLMCGTMTNIVTSVELTGPHAGDTTQFAALVDKTALSWKIDRVTADKAYLSAKNFELVNDRGGMLFVPFKETSVMGGKGRSEVWKTMFTYFHLHREQFMNFYHRRSNVETTFSMIKGKFGHRVRSKTAAAQENEILCKILCHNLCQIIHAIFELGINPSFLSQGGVR
jgi:transposase